MSRDQNYIDVERFGGLWARNDPAATPLGALVSASNLVRLVDGSIQSRYGIDETVKDFSGTWDAITGVFNYNWDSSTETSILIVGTKSLTNRIIVAMYNYDSNSYTVIYNREYAKGPVYSVKKNAGGSGYAVGDIVTVRDGYDCRLEITSVSAGAVTGFKLLSMGEEYATGTAKVTYGGTGTGFTVDIIVAPHGLSFVANKLYNKIFFGFYDVNPSVESIHYLHAFDKTAPTWGGIGAVTVNAGGTGYAVDDVVEVTGPVGSVGYGCILKVTAVAAGVVTAVASPLAEGREYKAGGTGLTTTAKKGTGTGLTVNITTHYPVCKLAACLKPSGFTLTAATSATAGNVETGRRLYAVAYETSTGFITKPGPIAWTLFNQGTANRKVDLSNIPVGPPGTVARHILVSQKILNYNSKTFNQFDYELFFIPSGRIPNNVDTTLKVNFYDSDLLVSAAYLQDQREKIPAGPILTDYNGRLIVGGGWDYPLEAQIWDATDSKIYIPKVASYRLYVSKMGAPESFDASKGLVDINPDDGDGRLAAAFDMRNNLYVCKSARTYATQDNNNSPNKWPVALIDGALGAYYNGIGKVLDSKDNSVSGAVIANRVGVFLFTGTFPQRPLTWQIEADWRTYAGGVSSYSKVCVLVDSNEKRLYIGGLAGNFGGVTLPLLTGDFLFGLDPENIAWYPWEHAMNTFEAQNTIDFRIVGKTTQRFCPIFVWGNKLYYASNVSSILRDDYAGSTYIISAVAQLGPFLFSDIRGKSLFALARFRAKGAGTLSMATALEDLASSTALTPTQTLTTTRTYYDRLINRISTSLFFKFSVGSNFDHWMNITRLTIFGSQYGSENPM